MGLRDKILKAKGRLRREPVEVPEWADLLEGEKVYVRELTGRERDEYEAERVKVTFGPRGRVSQEINLRNLRARLVVRTLVGEDGKRVFSEADAAEVGELGGAVLDRLFDVAQRLSGLSKDADEALLKNVLGAGGGPSSGTSPPPSVGPASNGACAGSAAAS